MESSSQHTSHFPEFPSSTDVRSQNFNFNNNSVSRNKFMNSTMMYGQNNINVADESDKIINNEHKKSDSGLTTESDLSKEGDMKHMEEDEEVDEPDAMSADKSSVNNHHNEGNGVKQFNGYVDSGEEDADEDDRLIIDDDENPSLSNINNGNQIFSCPQCHVVTTSAKAYLLHLDNVHNARESAKKPLTLQDHEEGEIVNSNRRMETGNFLSLPFHSSNAHSQGSLSPKDEDMEEDGNNSSVNVTPIPFSNPLASNLNIQMGNITPENIDQMFDGEKKKKKKTRQEVDPGKYFEVVDGAGTKYACSQCGNIYKWRKSLNKHWKEKHLNDPLVDSDTPPGMIELCKNGKYTQLGSRRLYDNNFLQTIKAQKEEDIPGTSSPARELQMTPPPNFLNTPNRPSLPTETTPAIPPLIPKMIGPFVASTAQPVFPGMSLALQQMIMQQNGYNPPVSSTSMDLANAAKTMGYSSLLAARVLDMNGAFDQDQPLDFSQKKDGPNTKSEIAREIPVSPFIKHDIDSLTPTPKLLKCTKCDYSTLSETDFANHTASHFNKRVSVCYECKTQFPTVEELNSHFIQEHNRKLTDYKEAIKKIPHGLQQSYHLLNMDLESIGELNSQDLGSSDTKSLKCNKCDFEAKWPAELQKHAVSHSEERPYLCMVCGSTYKWKWDLVKHFQKSHASLPNPYRRNDKRETPDASSEDDIEDEPEIKKAKMSAQSSPFNNMNPYNQEDMMSVNRMIAATQAGQRFLCSQLDEDQQQSLMESQMALMQSYPYAAMAAAMASGSQVGLAQEFMERQARLMESHSKAQKAIQEAIKSRHNIVNAKTSPSSSMVSGSSLSNQMMPTSPASGSGNNNDGGKGEQLPYKCTMCNYHARWPSEVTQHMKNHSDSKPYLCPRCDYRSKWKWDVVKHLKRCGGGTINDVIDTTKSKGKDTSPYNPVNKQGPPNAVVGQEGEIKKTTPQPYSFLIPSTDTNGQPASFIAQSSNMDANITNTTTSISSSQISPYKDGHLDLSIKNNKDRNDYTSNWSLNPNNSIDLSMNNNNDNNNNNNAEMQDNNVNNNYAAYVDGRPTPVSLVVPSPNLLSASNMTSPTLLTNSSHAPSLPFSPSAGASLRQTFSTETWKCPHCPFSTQSQAELKRHSGLHQDDKPFKCDECEYSTRWACDLKKHRKSYNHYPKWHLNNINNSSSIGAEHDNNSFNKLGEETQTKIQSKTRFKCNQCSLPQLTLQNLIDHRRSVHISVDQTPDSSLPKTNEIDAARIRHPRKQIKQFSCPKCPFICKNRQTMDKHVEEHEQQEKEALQCFYCDAQCKDKDTLLDHLVTHPAFSAKEWETYFMIPEEDELQEPGELKYKSEPEEIKPNHVQNQGLVDMTKLDPEAATQARIKKILAEIPKQLTTQQLQFKQMQQRQQKSLLTNVNKFKCEWCPAEFINLTAVYKHASIAHPIQLKEQDVNMSMAYANFQNRKQEHLKAMNANNNDGDKNDTSTSGDALQMLQKQIAEKRNHQLAEKLNHMVTNNPKLQEVLNKRLEEDANCQNLYRCDKCVFLTTSESEFKIHFEQHNFMYQNKCWFCDYKVERLDILYQHMKISHTRKWKNLSQNPLYANQIQRMNLAFSGSNPEMAAHFMQPMQSQTNINIPILSSSLNTKDSDIMDLSSTSKKPEQGQDIVYKRKTQYTWNNIPVNVVADGSLLSFGCPKCTFSDTAINKTCAHVKQSHRPMSKFNCTRCQFSDDKIDVMEDHCKICHPINERIVEMLDFKQLDFNELQHIQLNAAKEKASEETSQNIEQLTNRSPSSADSTSLIKHLTCPFCPYKTISKDSMKQHISNHSQNARFCCQNCDFSSDLPNIMSDHIRVHDPGYGDEMDLSHSPARQEPPSKQTYPNDPQRFQDKQINFNLTADIGKFSPKSKTPGRIRYRCSICPYHTTCKSNIIKHKRQHLIPKRYKCTICSYTAARAVLLRKHIESHSIPLTNEEGYYHDIFYDPHVDTNEKVEDIEDPAENEEVEAEDISEDDSNSDDLDSEMNSKAIADLEAKDLLEAEAAHKASNSHGEESDRQLRKQKCPHCPFNTNSYHEFNKHLNFHGTQERYKCDLCTYSIDRFNLLTQHRKLHVNDPDYNPNPAASVLLNTSFILQQNEMELDKQQKTSFENVSLEKDNDNTLSCDSCPFKSSDKTLFNSHMTGHEQKKRFICDLCDWTSDQLPHIQQHRSIHSKDPQFISFIPENVFLNQEFDDGSSGEFEAKLMDDNAIKDGDDSHNVAPFKLTVVKKNYPCKYCPYKTNFKNNYQIHKSMHSLNGTFSCSHCTFSTNSRGILQQHNALHSSQTPSPTSLAPKCNNKSSPVQNSPSHSNRSNLSCPYCDFKSSSEEMMFPHLQIHFPTTKLEYSAMAKMIEQQATLEYNNNNNINNSDRNELSSGGSSPVEDQAQKTRIYACKYCDREFEAKSLMFQHEKQHLAGSH